MKNITFTSVAAIAAISLSGCGGGGGGSTSDPRTGEVGIDLVETPAGVIDPTITIADARARFDKLNDGFKNVNKLNLPQRDVPTSNTYNYSGDIGFDIVGAVPGGGNVADASMVGDLNLAVNFGGNTSVTGSATNFLYADTAGNIDRASGALIVDGDIALNTSAGDLLDADATGQLTFNQGGTEKTVDFDLQLGAEFGGQAGADNGDTPETIIGFAVGNGTNFLGGEGDGLTLIIPRGRITGQTPGTDILTQP